jgi:hypothetical protein
VIKVEEVITSLIRILLTLILKNYEIVYFFKNVM